MNVCTNEEEIALILSSPVAEIFDIMHKAIEIEGIPMREWTFDWNDVRFTIKVEKKV